MHTVSAFGRWEDFKVWNVFQHKPFGSNSLENDQFGLNGFV
jgi:hypothetical protein